MLLTLHYPLQCIFESITVYGLRQEIVHAGRKAQIAVAGECVTGQGDDRHIRIPDGAGTA
jgi:hypothetical protein